MMNLQAPRILLCLSALLVFESSVFAFFVDGSGHYAVKARKKTQPTDDSQLDTEEGLVQSLRLCANLQKSEKTSKN